ncbi:hypothetical protein Mp_4g02660 [Marchantia polymorpha subsp. ruderalis]|uniref:Uncharacterized protein n=2 Tax=Marchantia polymorpha TaxID=3197 RepID=A0AAF6B5K8_MARPO|nr:hypothetical protein MARPO_0080s0033 [Marchantia polymorpha]BBN07292.1 hypothetical protein Mp_4g02660 [Marchantia polymorpha subsp. ruderalis]|eukprot:PTQ34412.1 hypothetical protein MARPO_0080s0033 [Marchantia polymorpha]
MRCKFFELQTCCTETCGIVFSSELWRSEDIVTNFFCKNRVTCRDLEEIERRCSKRPISRARVKFVHRFAASVLGIVGCEPE